MAIFFSNRCHTWHRPATEPAIVLDTSAEVSVCHVDHSLTPFLLDSIDEED